MAFVRAVSTSEWLYHKAARAFSPIVIQVVIEGRGRIGQAELQAALDQVSEAFPGCRLRMRGSRWHDDGCRPKVVPFSAYPDFKAGLNSSLHAYGAFDPHQGKTTEVGWAQEGERCLLVFRALHAVMDGKGLQTWANAVFQTLRGEALAAVGEAITDDDVLRGFSAPLRKDAPTIPASRGPRGLAHDSDEDVRFEYARLTLTGGTPGLIAKLAVASRDSLDSKDQGPSLFMIPVDIRDDIPSSSVGLQTGNLSLPVFLKLEPGDTWMEAAAKLLRRIESKTYLARGPADSVFRLASSRTLAWLLARLHHYQLKAGRYFVSAIISHVGKQSRGHYSCPGFQAESIVFLPSPMPICPFSLVVTEYEGALEICLGKSRSLPFPAAEMLNEIAARAGFTPKEVDRRLTPLAQLRPPLNAGERPRDIMHEIDEAVSFHAEKTALVDGSVTTSFQEYQHQRNRFARALKVRVGRDLRGERIALVLNRSTDAYLTIHACLALGAVFVPIDPLYAADRVAMIIEDSQAVLVVTESLDGELAGASALSLASLRSLASSQSPAPLEADYDPEWIAYIIFTSGTTGRPKGVTITRNNLGHYLDSALKAHLKAYPQRGLALFTALSFDISITPLFGSLLIGCPLVIIRENSAPLAMAELLQRPEVTYAMMTPAHLQVLLSVGQRPVSRWLTLAVGGEGWTWDLACQAKELFGETVTIYNVYGPTEATVVMAIYRLDFNHPEREGLPIATAPVDHTSLYILDENLQDTLEGELCIGGHSVARGYWGDAEKSALSFVPDPYRPGFTMYRSGDKAVFKDGKLYCIGRIDDQVKINGFRVELDEITSALKACSGIQDGIVLLEKNGPKPTLHAFYSANVELSDEAIRESLKQTLPHFMIPSSFIKVEAMPLTINGKIDRKSLLAMIPAYETPPETLAGFDLRDIWARSLGLPYEQLRLNSDYFELGGDSVTLLRILHEIDAKKFQGRAFARLFANVKDFLAMPTLRQMIRMVEGIEKEGA